MIKKHKILLPLTIILLIIITVTTFLTLYSTNDKLTVSEKDRYCKTDNDCISFTLQCGFCQDNDVAFNKKYGAKYSDMYDKKCGDNISRCLSIIPRNISSCINNLCTLDK